jgi:hypothetical protein
MRHGDKQDAKGEWVQSREKRVVIHHQSVFRWRSMEGREAARRLNDVEL